MLLHHSYPRQGISKREHQAGIFAGFACGLAAGIVLMEVLRVYSQPAPRPRPRQEHALPPFDPPKAKPMPFFAKKEKCGPRIINLKKKN